ncbi:hypothetical protein VTL71DRAFT_7912 [Oculimacula yallundae]|uniref:Uncharacterized protein n=1 Tax=Oculimacula yallundae TaxID=86028 RepID=A0ABR4CYJ7_9HELO
MTESISPKAQSWIDTEAAKTRLNLLGIGQSGQETVQLLLQDAKYAYETINARQMENAELKAHLILANERASTAERAAETNAVEAVKSKGADSVENARLREQVRMLKAAGGDTSLNGFSDATLKELVDFANTVTDAGPTFVEEFRRLLGHQGQSEYAGAKNRFTGAGRCQLDFDEYINLFDGMVEKSWVLQETIAILQTKIRTEATKSVYQGDSPIHIDAEIKRLARLLDEANAEAEHYRVLALENTRLAKELSTAKIDAELAQQGALELQAQLDANSRYSQPSHSPEPGRGYDPNDGPDSPHFPITPDTPEELELQQRVNDLEDDVAGLLIKLGNAQDENEELKNGDRDKDLEDCRETVRKLKEEKKTGGNGDQLKALQKQLKALQELRKFDKIAIARLTEVAEQANSDVVIEKAELQRLLDECNAAHTIAAATPTANPVSKAEVTKLKKEIKELKAERDDLRTQLDDIGEDPSEEAETIKGLRAEIKEINKALAKAKRDLKKCGKKTAEFEAEALRLNDALEESVATANRIRGERTAAREERNALRVRVQEAEEALDDDSGELQAQLEDARRNARTAEAAHTNILALNAELTVERDAARAQLKSKSDDEESDSGDKESNYDYEESISEDGATIPDDEETKRLRDEIKKLKRDLEDTRRLLEGTRVFVKAENDRFVAQINQLQDALATAREQLQSLQTALEDATSSDENESDRNKRLANRLQEAEANIRSLEQALEIQTPAANDAEAAELRMQLATAQTDIQRLANLTPEGEEFENQRAEIQRLTELLQDCDDARRRLTLAEADVKRLQELHDKNHGQGQSENVVDDCPEQLRKYHETEIARLRKQVGSDTQVSRLQYRIEQLSREIGANIANLATARGEIRKLTAQLQEGSPETDADLRRRITDCNKEAEKRDSEYGELLAYRAHDELRLRDAEDIKQDLDNEVAALKLLITKLQSGLTDCLEKNPNSDNQELVKALQESERAQEERLLNRPPQGDDISSSIHLKQAYKEIDRLTNQVQTLWSAEYSAEVWQLSEDERNAHKNQVEDLESQIAELQQQIEELKKKNAELADELRIQKASFNTILEAVARETAKGKNVIGKDENAEPEQRGLFDENVDSGEGENSPSDPPQIITPPGHSIPNAELRTGFWAPRTAAQAAEHAASYRLRPFTPYPPRDPNRRMCGHRRAYGNPEEQSPKGPDSESGCEEDPEDSEDYQVEETPSKAAAICKCLPIPFRPPGPSPAPIYLSKPQAHPTLPADSGEKPIECYPPGNASRSNRNIFDGISKPEVQVPSKPSSSPSDTSSKPATKPTKKKTATTETSQETKSEVPVVVERRVTRSSTPGGLKRKEVPEQKVVKEKAGDKRRKMSE